MLRQRDAQAMLVILLAFWLVSCVGAYGKVKDSTCVSGRCQKSLSEIFLLLKCSFVYFWKRESGGEAEKERERETQAGSALSMQSPTWAQSHDGEIMTWVETDRQMLNWLGHPSPLVYEIFLKCHRIICEQQTGALILFPHSVFNVQIYLMLFIILYVIYV